MKLGRPGDSMEGGAGQRGLTTDEVYELGWGPGAQGSLKIIPMA